MTVIKEFVYVNILQRMVLFFSYGGLFSTLIILLNVKYLYFKLYVTRPPGRGNYFNYTTMNYRKHPKMLIKLFLNHENLNFRWVKVLKSKKMKVLFPNI